MDKIPNTDGILTLTGKDQIPKGRLDVQLKTLSKKKKTNPTFQCELALLAYVEEEMLPVILIVVDQVNKKAYWRHLDYALLRELSPKIKGDTVALPMLQEQFLDGTNHDYLDFWNTILEKTKAKYVKYDLIENQRNALLMELGRLNDRIMPAFSLNHAEIREIHIFLDILNNLYDCEFRTIKQILYFNFWKIGIAIAAYEPNTSTFFIIPQALTDNSPLIKQVKDIDEIHKDEIFLEDGALSLQWSGDRNSIREMPDAVALKTVCKDVFKVIDKIHLSIPDPMAAREYLAKFTEDFYQFLGLPDRNFPISIERLRALILAILPVTIEQRVSFGQGIKISTYGIDGLMGEKAGNYHNQIQNAETLIASGYLPKVTVTLDSKKFDMKLIEHYMSYLTKLGVVEISSPYTDFKIPGIPNFGPWMGLKEEDAFKTLKIMLEKFSQIYPVFIEEKFPYLHKELGLFKEYQLIIYIWHFDPSKRAFVETYHCVSEKPVDNRYLLFKGDDKNCPKGFESRQNNPDQWSVRIDGIDYEIRMKGSRTIWFLLDPFPLHSLIREELSKNLDSYFKEKGLKDTPYRERFQR